MNTDSITLALSRRLAAADGRNQQQAMIRTAQQLRSSTRDTETYSVLGEFITCSPGDRQQIVNAVEFMITSTTSMSSS